MERNRSLNIVLIIVDDLNDWLDAWIVIPMPTPRILMLAEHGMLTSNTVIPPNVDRPEPA